MYTVLNLKSAIVNLSPSESFSTQYKNCSEAGHELLVNCVGYFGLLQGTPFPCSLKQISALSWHVAVKILASAWYTRVYFFSIWYVDALRFLQPVGRRLPTTTPLL